MKFSLKEGVAIIKKNRVISAISAVLIVVIVMQILGNSKAPASTTTEDVLPLVTVGTVESLNGVQSVSLIGTVRAFTEAPVTAEASGRVVSVNGVLGQSIPAGFVIASLENASERAAVLQAEGGYDAALAATAQSGVSVDQANNSLKTAENAAVTTVKTSFNTVNGVIRNNIDAFFSNPDGRLPGLKLDGKGNTPQLNNERIAYQTILTEWQTRVSQLSTQSDLDGTLDDAGELLDRTISLIDTFIFLFNDQDSNSGAYTNEELVTFSTTFTTLRSSLLSTKASLNDAGTALDSARDGVRQAELGAAGNQNSAADAQVKQALGSLRAAQANLAKTILRAPVSGTINALDVRVGDFVGQQQVVAKVANNNALEVITFVGDKEISAFTVGETVSIENKYPGVVTAIAPAVDSVTKKTEVRIALETNEVQNGDTVKISKDITVNEDTAIIVPLSAVKFEIENGFIFMVENGVLVSKPVTLGAVRGGSVEITEGLTATDEFVLDARGLLAGSKVEVKN